VNAKVLLQVIQTPVASAILRSALVA
jgi:hypothetical protein